MCGSDVRLPRALRDFVDENGDLWVEYSDFCAWKLPMKDSVKIRLNGMLWRKVESDAEVW